MFPMGKSNSTDARSCPLAALNTRRSSRGAVVPRSRYLLVILLASFIGRVQAQDAREPASDLYFGIGGGLDHGGFGLRFDGMVTRALGLFAGAGFNLATVGWNGGLIYRHPLPGRVRPYGTAMYGYNVAILTTTSRGSIGTGTNYYGPSFGAGVEFWSDQRNRFVHLGLLLPVRSEEAQRELRRSASEPWPVLLSAGFHF